MSFEKCWIGGTAPKIQKSSCPPRWYCERWFWISCSIYRTRIISITNDSRKNHGCHIRTARVRRTSSGRSVSLWKMLHNYWIFPNRNVQTFGFVYQLLKAKVMVKYGRTGRSSERNLYGHPLAGLLSERQFEKNLLKHSWEKVSSWECLFAHREKFILICVCGWHQIGWKEAKHWSDVESTQRRSWFGRTNIFPWSCISGMYSKTMWNKQRSCWQLQNHVWITNFRGVNWKITMLGKSVYIFVVLRYGRSCQEMCGKILWQQLYKVSTPCIDDHHVKEEELKSVGDLSKKYALKLFWNACTWHVLEDLMYGQWTNLHDQSLNGPKLVTNDWIVWYLTSITHVNTNSIVMWVILLNNADWDCFKTPILREIWRTQNRLRVEHCAFLEVIHLFQSVGCVRNKTSVSHSSTESEIISLDAGLRLDGIPALDLWDLIVSVFGNTTQTEPYRTERPVVEQTWKLVLHLTRFTNVRNLEEWPMIWIMLILFPRTSNFRIKKLCCMCLKTTLAQGEWSGAREAKPILKRCNKRQRQTFCDMVNVYVFYIANICIHGEELLRQFAFHRKYRRSHNETDVRFFWEIDNRTIRRDLWNEYN